MPRTIPSAVSQCNSSIPVVLAVFDESQFRTEERVPGDTALSPHGSDRYYVIGLYMKDFFDYGIADEVHELSNDTAQGNALGTLARAVDKIAVLTGTLMGGYADDLFKRAVPA